MIAFDTVATCPKDREWRYQIAVPVQLDPDTVGFLTNIRLCSVKSVDIEAGSDMIVTERGSYLVPKSVTVLNRSELEIHPDTRRPMFTVRYPFSAGFIPRGAKRADGSEHPHQGTGFGLCQSIGFPADKDGRILVRGEWEIEAKDRYHKIELQQYRYDGRKFHIERSEVLDPSEIFQGYRLTGISLGPFIPEGDDLIGGSTYAKEERICGLSRWKRTDGKWMPCDFYPIPEALDFGESSVVRDCDGSLLFCARPGRDSSYANDILVWRSSGTYSQWERIIHKRGARAMTPVTINRTADGRAYIAGNPHRLTDSFGREGHSVNMRETLLIWQISDDRKSLMEPVTVKDCNSDFGIPPHGSKWRADHPIGFDICSTEGQSRHILTYRVMEESEGRWGSPPTAYTGTYIDDLTTGNL